MSMFPRRVAGCRRFSGRVEVGGVWTLEMLFGLFAHDHRIIYDTRQHCQLN